MKPFIFLILFFFSSSLANTFTKEEKNYIETTNIKVAVVPDIYPFESYEIKKLKEISFDILELIRKKSSLDFNYQKKSAFEELKKYKDDKMLKKGIHEQNIQKTYKKLPIAIFSNNTLEKYYQLDKTNPNIFYKNDFDGYDSYDIIQNYGLDKYQNSIAFSKVDLIIAPLLKIQTSILKKSKDNKNLPKIKNIKKDDIEFGIDKENKILSSIILKSFSQITQKEWNELQNKWNRSIENKIVLNEKEKKYLKEKKVLNICTNNQYEPFIFTDKNNKLNGITIDMLNLFQKELNVIFKYKKTNSMEESISLLNANQCDIISDIFDDKLQISNISFTDSYINSKLAIVSKKQKDTNTNIDTMLNEVLSVEKNSNYLKKIKDEFPNANILETTDQYQSLELVNKDKTDYTVCAVPMAKYLISKYDMNNLYISSYMDIPYDLKMAVKSDNQTLKNLLNKALEKITKKEKKDIVNRWSNAPKEKVINYTLLLYILGAMAFIFAILAYRQIVLSKYNKQLKKAHDETNQKNMELKLLTNNLEKIVEKQLAENEEKTKHLIQQSKLAQMGELLSMIAHQWRQPLSYISTTTNYILAQSLLEKKLSKKELENELRLILEYSQHLSTTINDFKNFYKIDKKQTKITLEDICNKSINIIKASLDNSSIEIKTSYNSFKEINTYASEVNQVILNILKNAEDAILEKKVNTPKIVLKTYYMDDKVHLEIIDNGGGIKNENILKLFDPYFSTKISKDGSGLGLYMSKTIIEDHCNGKLSVKNNDTGATFTISLKYN